MYHPAYSTIILTLNCSNKMNSRYPMLQILRWRSYVTTQTHSLATSRRSVHHNTTTCLVSISSICNQWATQAGSTPAFISRPYSKASGDEKSYKSNGSDSRKSVQFNKQRTKQKENLSEKPNWLVQKEANKSKFPDGWRPFKRLSPDAITGIRALHKQFPEEFSTPVLAQQFQISAEAVRRILKGKWEPSAKEEEKRTERWYRRGLSVWSRYAEMGMKPPSRWREAGVTREPGFNERRRERATSHKKKKPDVPTNE